MHLKLKKEDADKEFTFSGWVENIKGFKKFALLTIRVGTDRVQVIYDSPTVPCDAGAYVKVTGTASLLPEGKFAEQPVEIRGAKLDVISPSTPEYLAICPPSASNDVKLDQRHMYLRDYRFSLITKLRAVFIKAIRKHFETSGCTEVLPPSFVGNCSEGGASLFALKYPGRDSEHDMTVYLTQSSQFYLEMAVPAQGDVYCIAPSFRAERSHTRRHLTEFVHVESEWANIFSLEDHCAKLKDLLAGMFKYLIKYADKEQLLQKLGIYDRVLGLQKMCDDIMIMTHAEAIQYCREHNIYRDEELKEHFDALDDIPEAQERRMIDEIGKIVFLTMFPHHFKSFYMKRDPANPTYVWGVDVEVPTVGEVIGSGVRESDHDELMKFLLEQKLKPEEYKEYLDLRKYGHGKTSGMGLGLDRMLTWIVGEDNIRKVVTFPRYPGRVFP